MLNTCDAQAVHESIRLGDVSLQIEMWEGTAQTVP